jgi:hypothetical protein
MKRISLQTYLSISIRAILASLNDAPIGRPKRRPKQIGFALAALLSQILVRHECLNLTLALTFLGLVKANCRQAF